MLCAERIEIEGKEELEAQRPTHCIGGPVSQIQGGESEEVSNGATLPMSISLTTCLLQVLAGCCGCHKLSGQQGTLTYTVTAWRASCVTVLGEPVWP